MSGPSFTSQRRNHARLQTIYFLRDFVDKSGLMSYSPDYSVM
jgi:putative ABC transport system substrate-binding protein